MVSFLKGVSGLNDLISVIVPIYNVEQYLEKCIESIRQQSYQHIEILLINDGSTDNSEQICLDYVNKDNRIQYFKKENGGLSDTRNYGIERSSGEYLSFVDSDDYIAENFIEKLYESIKEQKSDISICNVVKVHENGEIEQELDWEFPVVNTSRNIYRSHLLDYDYRLVISCNKLYKRHLFDTIRFEVGRIHEDEFIAFLLYDKAEKISFLQKDGLYFYLQRFGSITKTSKPVSKQFDSLIDFPQKRIEFYQKKNDDELLDLSLASYCQFLIHLVSWDIFGKKERQVLQELFREYYKQLKIRKVDSQLSFTKRVAFFVADYNILLVKPIKNVFSKKVLPR